jgi:hypothetical protein
MWVLGLSLIINQITLGYPEAVQMGETSLLFEAGVAVSG